MALDLKTHITGILTELAWDDPPAKVSPEQLLLLVYEPLRRLAALDEREARVVELRSFAGLSTEEIGRFLGVSERTVRNDWAHARAWLARELSQARGA